MTYPKAVMTIGELKKMGFKEEWLREIYRSRSIERDYSIAWKLSPNKQNSPIQFDTEALEKYRRSQCTGE